jgi:RNA polymerase sigma factor (sigma-70 family)
MSQSQSDPPPDLAADVDARDISRHYSALAPALERFARRLLGDADEARDVLQDTFVKLHCVGRDWPDNVSQWLYRVAANNVCDRLRKKSRFTRYLIMAGATAGHGRIESDAERQADYHRIFAKLQTLPVRERLLITLYQEGLSYADLAAAAGLRQASVGKTLARALDKLARLMQGGST